MTDVVQRAERLAKLYRFQRQVHLEISELEDQIQREVDALARARAAAREAGLKPAQRRAECGTDSGYYHHLRTRKEKACYPCKLAHRAAERSRWKRRQERLESGAA